MPRAARPLGPATLLLATLLGAPLSAHDGVSRELAVLEHRLRAAPDDLSLRLAAAVARRRAGDAQGALRDVDVALAGSPDHLDARLLRGLALADLGRDDDALVELSRVLDRGEVRPALVARATLLEARGDLLGARSDWDRAVTVAMDPEAALARGHVDERLGDLERAVEGYEAAFAALSGSLPVRLALVRAASLAGRHGRAIALADELVEASAAKADALLTRAGALAAAGRASDARRDREAALADCEALLRERPTDLRRLTKARVLAALGRKAEARRLAEEVARSSPKLADARALVAELEVSR